MQRGRVKIGIPAGRDRPGRWLTLGAVVLAAVVGYVVAVSTSLVVAGPDRYPVPQATGTLVFLLALWLLARYLVPGRRPPSMPTPWKSILGSVAAGLVVAAIAIGCTWAYLASITIDDGLEGLIFLPILGATGVVVALVARTGTARFRPVVASAAACVGTGIFMIALQRSRSGGGPPITETYTFVVLGLFPLALCGVALGTLLGDAIRPRVRRAAR